VARQGERGENRREIRNSLICYDAGPFEFGGGACVTADQTPHDGDLPDKARSVELPTGGPIKMNGAPITALTSVLSTALAEPVNDSTGLQGRYDITLNLAIGDLMAVHQAPSASDGGGYTPNSIFDAVRDLGLRLVPQKAEVKHLTVVKADRIPSEN